MTVHSLVLFENGIFTEISKALDISVHNSLMSPDTNALVEDNYITFFYPDHLDRDVVFDYVRHHDLHLIDGVEVLAGNVNPFLYNRKAISFDSWDKPEFLEGYKMYRIHYWTDEPIHWVLNPKKDMFVFNNDIVESLALCN